MNKFWLSIVAVSFASICAKTATLPAFAADNETVDKANVLEEVTVTAEKITQDLQKTALSVTAISADSLNQANIASPKDLNSVAPGLVVNSTPSNPLALSIRGAGYQGIQNNSAQPGVSFNENGVYISSPVSLESDFLDVDQIEVLRGPQGTVLGQNSDGGALNVTTVRPQLQMFSSTAELSYGNYNYDRVRLIGNIPVGDTIAVRVAFQQQFHQGYTKATEVPGQANYQLGNEDSYGGRLDSLWKPNERWTLELWAELHTNNANGNAFKNIDDPNPDPYRVTQDFPAKLDSRSDIYAGNASYDFGWAMAKLITSYQYGKYSAPESLDKLDFANAISVFGVHDIAAVDEREGHSKTQEFDLISAQGSNFDWIAGVFFIQQAYDEGFLEYQYDNPHLLLPANINDSTAVFATNSLAFETEDTQRLKSSSIYGQGTYHVADNLRFTGGLRGTKNQQEGLISVYYGQAVDVKTDFKALTGKAVVEYDLSPANTVYTLWSTGIKPGGTNLNPGSEVIPAVFKPERNDALELGSKNQFLDQTLRLNVAAFYNSYRDYQIDSEDPIPFKGGTTNIPEVKTYGLEGELSALLPHYFRIDANLAMAGGKVKSHEQIFDPEIAQTINRNDGGVFNGNDVADRTAAFFSSSSDAYGRTPPQLPAFSSNIGASEAMHLSNGDVFTSQLKYSYRTKYFFRIYDNPVTDVVPTLQQWDLNFSYIFSSKALHVDFLVKNLLDKASVLSRYTDNFGVGAVSNYYVPPRLFILRAGYAF